MVENNRPIKVYKAGVLSLNVWENELEDNKKIKSYSLRRVYKDNTDGNWKDCSSFRTSDLPKLKVLIEKAFGDAILVEE